MYVFAYGSLMNPKSLALTLPGERKTIPARLNGYKRRINVPYGDYLYLNIVPRADSFVDGVLFELDETELQLLLPRESASRCADVSAEFESYVPGPVYAFIAPDIEYPGLKIAQSYIHTCLSALPKDIRDAWLADTIIENEVVDDLGAPIYESAALE